MFECVINISEGRDLEALAALSRAAGASLRDRHADPYHHRSVFTLVNDPNALTRDVKDLLIKAFEILDLSDHEGVHPRFGVVDVVPFVALAPDDPDDARRMRDDTARWISGAFAVPTFLYGRLSNGTTRTLPELRKGAFSTLAPDFGPPTPSSTLGAVAVGERGVLVAWNIWLGNTTIERARELARIVRSSSVRSLAFEVGDQVQVSCNLIDIATARPSHVYDRVRAALAPGEVIDGVELVGLIPRSLLEAEDPTRWGQLGLGPDLTIEARTG